VSKQTNVEDKDKINFPPTYNEFHEGERKMDESKSPKWMDTKIKYKKVNI